jgi:hypothetical protein
MHWFFAINVVRRVQFLLNCLIVEHLVQVILVLSIIGRVLFELELLLDVLNASEYFNLAFIGLLFFLVKIHHLQVLLILFNSVNIFVLLNYFLTLIALV